MANFHVWRPSSARRVVFDGFVPVPRGSGVVPPLAWPAKDPADVLDYEFDFSAALVGNEGDELSGVSVAVTPEGAGAVAVNSVAGDGGMAVLWLSGGQAGVVYSVQVSVTTASGRSLGRAVLLPVVALAGAGAAAGILVTELGVAITDQAGAALAIGG